MPDQTPEPYQFGNTLEVRTLGDYRTGQGYDALKFVHATPAIEQIEPRPSGRDFGNTKVWAATSARQIIQKMEAEIDMKGTYLGVQVGVAAKLVQSFTYNETSFMVVARQTIEAGALSIVDDPGKIVLSEEAAQRLKTDLAQFHRKYGGYYCHTVVLGGEVYVAYQCTMRTRERASEISGKIEGSYPDLGSLMVSMSATMTETAKESRWMMTAQTLGAGGTLDDFDPKDPESVRKAVMKFLRDFEANVRADPQPYFGRYDGYWRFFAEAEPLKRKVYETSVIVDELCEWGAAYADLIASINAFLDPDNGEGYTTADIDKKELLKLRDKINDAIKALSDAFSVMELFDDFRRPGEIEKLKGHDPAEYRKAVEAFRSRLKAQLVMGQQVYLYFPQSTYQVASASDSLPDGVEPPDVSAAEPLSGKYPYIRLAFTGAAAYRIEPVTKDVGAVLCHGDTIKLAQRTLAKYRDWQIYTSSWTSWALGLAPYEESYANQYKWKVSIVGYSPKKGATPRAVTTNDKIRLTCVWRDKYIMCINHTDYLYVMDGGNYENQLRFLKSPAK